MTPDSIFIGLLFTVPLLTWAVFSYRALRRAAISKAWPSTNGVVVQVVAVTLQSYRLPATLARVEYRYRVAGSDYTSTSQGRGRDTTLFSLYPAAASLSPGATVTVFHDPLDPKSAVLVPGATYHDWLAFLTPLVAWGLVLWLLTGRVS